MVYLIFSGSIQRQRMQKHWLNYEEYLLECGEFCLKEYISPSVSLIIEVLLGEQLLMGKTLYTNVFLAGNRGRKKGLFLSKLFFR